MSVLYSVARRGYLRYKRSRTLFGKITAQKDDVIIMLEDNREALKSLGVIKLDLFGSCVRGEECAESDLDFIVSLETSCFDSYMDLKYFLEGLFNCPVDLVLENTIKPRLRPSIKNEAVYATGL